MCVKDIKDTKDIAYREYLQDRPGLIQMSETEKHLHASRPKTHKTDAFQSCDMTPDDVDYEMSFPKSKKVLEIHGMNQESLEHFVLHYGATYEYLHFFHCQKIADFSPLEDMPNLRDVNITWNNCATRLWDLSRNSRLMGLGIIDAKKMTSNALPLLETGKKNLREIYVSGDIFNGYPMKDLNCFAGFSMLRHLALNQIKLADKDTAFLDTLPVLEEFDFDPGMFTTEQIAHLCAKYPHLGGRFMGPWGVEYNTDTYIRVSGYRKPTLEIPRQQAALDKHVAKFNALVEKYRKELEKN